MEAQILKFRPINRVSYHDRMLLNQMAGYYLDRPLVEVLMCLQMDYDEFSEKSVTFELFKAEFFSVMTKKALTN